MIEKVYIFAKLIVLFIKFLWEIEFCLMIRKYEMSVI